MSRVSVSTDESCLLVYYLFGTLVLLTLLIPRNVHAQLDETRSCERQVMEMNCPTERCDALGWGCYSFHAFCMYDSGSGGEGFVYTESFTDNPDYAGLPASGGPIDVDHSSCSESSATSGSNEEQLFYHYEEVICKATCICWKCQSGTQYPDKGFEYF